MDPWKISESAFPSFVPISEKLMFLMRYAILAPSPYNTQPWQFRVGHGHIDLSADQSRALPQADPAGRQMAMSLGAVAEVFLLAASHFGFVADVGIFPRIEDLPWVARITVRAQEENDSADTPLFRAIPLRRRDIEHFDPGCPSEFLQHELRSIAESAGVYMRFVNATQDVQDIGALVRGAELARAR